MSAWEDVLLDSGDQRKPAEWWWAYVTDTDPLRIRRELETHPLGSTPSTIEANLQIGDKVRVVNYLGQALIVGRAGGTRIPFILAGGYVDMEGTGTKTVTLPAGVFDRAPIVTISGAQGTQSPPQDVRAYDATATSFVVLYQRASDWSNPHAGTRRFAWHAIQMTSDSTGG